MDKINNISDKPFGSALFILFTLIILTTGCLKGDNENYKTTFYLVFDEEFEVNKTYKEIQLFIDDALVYNCTKSAYPFDPLTPHGQYTTTLKQGTYDIKIYYWNKTFVGRKTLSVNKELYVRSRLLNNSSVEITLLDGVMKLK